MKRKSPSDQLPAPVRIVRPKIEIIHDTNDETTSATSASLSASSSGSIVLPVLAETTMADGNVQTDATSISSDSDEGDDSDDSDSLGESSSEQSADSAGSEAEDIDMKSIEEPSSHDLMSGLSRNETGAVASVYQDTATGVTTVRMGSKPVIDSSILRSSGSIVKRLKRLLPELQESNQVLDSEVLDGSIAKRVISVRNHDGDEAESSDEQGTQGDTDGEYIEMNLGLGVLEEQIDTYPTTSTVESNVAHRLFGGQQSTKQQAAIYDVHDVDQAMQ